MALVFNDRVRETASNPGTGTLSLLGAPTGFQTFSAGIGNTNTCYYAIQVANSDGTYGPDWEVGLGTVSAGALSRDTVYQSSNSDNLVNFTGTVQVFNTIPSQYLNTTLPGTFLKLDQTTPQSIITTNKVTNLNADLLDGKDTGTSGNTVGLLDGNNTTSGNNIHTGTESFNNTATFNAAITQNNQSGITSDVSTTITAGNTFDLTISLSDAYFKYGRILIRRQSGVLLPRDFCIIWCKNATSIGYSESFASNTTYIVSYSMAQGDSYLSHQVYSSAVSGIRVQDAYISGTSLIISFYNADGLTRTLNAYVDWSVWK